MKMESVKKLGVDPAHMLTVLGGGQMTMQMA